MPIIIKNKAGVIQPKLIGVSIDKLAITVDLPAKDQDTFIDVLESWKCWGPKGGHAFGQALYLDDMVPWYKDKANDTRLLIQYGYNPNFPKLKFLRCEGAHVSRG